MPFDGGSTYLRGSALGPPLIREALHCDSTNLWTEDGIDLGARGTINDLGDLSLSSDPLAASQEIEEAVREHSAKHRPLICLGGDHSITLPIVRGLHAVVGDVTIVQFDAHPDLYDEFQGRFSHACQFARIMEEKLARRLVQVGIRTMNGHQLEQATRFGVEVVAMRNIRQFWAVRLDGPIYVSFDLDALDPAAAPGVAHHEPGGLSVREALTMLQAISVPIVGADIVEYNPSRDVNRQTAMVGAKILKELAAAMLH